MNPPKTGDELSWDIPHLYHNLIEGLTEVGRSYESVNSISCNSWGHDYMLFDSDGSLITATFAQPTPRARANMDEVLTGHDLDAASRRAYAQALESAGLGDDDVEYRASTGFGRYQVPFRDLATTEITCHAVGAVHLFPRTRSVLDIGAPGLLPPGVVFADPITTLRFDAVGRPTNPPPREITIEVARSGARRSVVVSPEGMVSRR